MNESLEQARLFAAVGCHAVNESVPLTAIHVMLAETADASAIVVGRLNNRPKGD